MKKICVLLVAVLLLVSLPTAVMADEGITKTELVNVAKNKPVLTDFGPSYDPQILVDDDLRNNNFWEATASGGNVNFAIDLQRRYSIEKLMLFDRGDATGPYRGQFEIWGADKADFSDERLLFELNDNSVFPEKGDYTITLADKPICRYVRYKAKTNGIVRLREVQVYATLTATEISRGATTYTTKTYGGLEGDKAVDGNLSTAYATSNVEGVASTITLDLGTPQHVDMLELVARRAGSNAIINGNFNIYGSNDGTVTDYSDESVTGTAVRGMTIADFEAYEATAGQRVYTRLARMDYDSQTYTLSDGSTYTPYPIYNATTNPDNGPWQTMLNSDTAYRYITHRRSLIKYVTGVAEIRAYVVHPEIYSMTYADGKILLDCSDVMDAASVAAAVQATAAGSTEPLAVQAAANPDNAYQMVLTLPELFDKKLTITVGTTATNTKGTALAAEKSLDVTLPKALGITAPTVTDEGGQPLTSLAGKASVTISVPVENRASADNQKLLLVMCAYDSNHSLKGVKVSETEVAPGTPAPVTLTLTPDTAFAAGDYVTIHAWDGWQAAAAWMDMMTIPY